MQPPEYISTKEYTSAGDVYCLGLALYNISMGKPAFESKYGEELMKLNL